MRARPIIIAALGAGIVVAFLARRRARRRDKLFFETPLEDDAMFYEEITLERVRDDNEFVMPTVQTMDRERVDDDQAALGATWLEVLQEDVIEGGTPDRALDFVDVEDLDFPPSDGRDRPIADKGSGGRRGL